MLQTFIAISSCMRTAFSKSRLWESTLRRGISESGSTWMLSSSNTVIFTAALSFFNCWMYSRRRYSSDFVNSVSVELPLELVVLNKWQMTKSLKSYLKKNDNLFKLSSFFLFFFFNSDLICRKEGNKKKWIFKLIEEFCLESLQTQAQDEYHAGYNRTCVWKTGLGVVFFFLQDETSFNY